MAKQRFREADFELPVLAIIYLRDTKNWSYEDIAKRVDCDKATIWRTHTQGSQPRKYTIKVLQRLALKVWRAEQRKKK